MDVETIIPTVEPTNAEDTPITEHCGEMEVQRSGRPNRGQCVVRYEPGIGSKQYHNQQRIYKQFVQKKRLERTKRHVLHMMLIRKLNKKKDVQFFQIAINTMFLSTQISARKGVKYFGERMVAVMIKEFRQLDQGAFPGKHVAEPNRPININRGETTTNF